MTLIMGSMEAARVVMSVVVALLIFPVLQWLQERSRGPNNGIHGGRQSCDVGRGSLTYFPGPWRVYQCYPGMVRKQGGRARLYV